MVICKAIYTAPPLACHYLWIISLSASFRGQNIWKSETGKSASYAGWSGTPQFSV